MCQTPELHAAWRLLLLFIIVTCALPRGEQKYDRGQRRHNNRLQKRRFRKSTKSKNSFKKPKQPLKVLNKVRNEDVPVKVSSDPTSIAIENVSSTPALSLTQLHINNVPNLKSHTPSSESSLSRSPIVLDFTDTLTILPVTSNPLPMMQKMPVIISPVSPSLIPQKIPSSKPILSDKTKSSPQTSIEENASKGVSALSSSYNNYTTKEQEKGKNTIEINCSNSLSEDNYGWKYSNEINFDYTIETNETITGNIIRLIDKSVAKLVSLHFLDCLHNSQSRKRRYTRTINEEFYSVSSVPLDTPSLTSE